jgi:hypothetical protein
VDVLRTAAVRSAAATGGDGSLWQAPATDDAFLHAFAMALVSPTVHLDGTPVVVPQEQQLLLQAAAAAVLATADDRVSGSGDARRTRSGSALHTSQQLLHKRSDGGSATAENLPELPHLDFSDLPNTAEMRTLREYAAQCETHVQLHQTRVCMPTPLGFGFAIR